MNNNKQFRAVRKSLCAAMVFCLLALAGGMAAEAQQYRVSHYDLRLDIGHLQPRTISGEARLSVVPLGPAGEPLRLALCTGSIDSVLIDGLATTQFSFADGTLSLPTEGREQPFQVAVHYRTPGQVESYGWGGFHWGSAIAYNLGVAFGEYPHGYGRAWFPCLDQFDQKATYRMELTSPTGWTTTASGLRDTAWLNPDGSETSRWTLSHPTPTYLVSVACGPFRYIRRPIAGHPAVIAFGSQDSLRVARAFDQLDLVVPHFERCFGPYRWGTIGYTGTPQGSMEHANNISLHNSAMTDLSQSGQGTMAHELSHAWFGNLVTCATSEDMWINEGGASFCEEVAAEAVGGKRKALQVYEDKLYSVLASAHLADQGYHPLYGPTHDRTYGSTTYDKGALVWHSLRSTLGDSLFYASLRRLFSACAFSNISTLQLRDSLSLYSGHDLSHFFRFHVFAPGFADVSVDRLRCRPARQEGRWEVTVALSQRLKGNDSLAFAPLESLPLSFFQGHRLVGRASMPLMSQADSATFLLDACPDMAVVDLERSLALAVTRHDTLLTSRATIDMPRCLARISPSSTPTDTALFLMALHWTAPSPEPQPNPAILRTANRHWVLDAHLPENLGGTLFLKYDRDNSADFDRLLLPTQESFDSVRILYRPSPDMPWQVLSTAHGGNIIEGYFRTSSLRPGQYTLAVVDPERLSLPSAATTAPMAIYPNPTRGELTLEPPLPGCLLQVYDLEGRLVHQQTLPNTLRVGLNLHLPSGSYLFRLSLPAQGVDQRQWVVFNKF